jgi:hypothetical protein
MSGERFITLIRQGDHRSYFQSNSFLEHRSWGDFIQGAYTYSYKKPPWDWAHSSASSV